MKLKNKKFKSKKFKSKILFINFIITCVIVFVIVSLTFEFGFFDRIIDLIIYSIINRRFDLLAFLLAFIAVFFSFILYPLYQRYRNYLEFGIKVDEEGLFFNISKAYIPKAYADYYELEVPKGKFLWRQIESVQYDSKEKIIYLILLSKAKIPIPLILFDKRDIEAILKEISKYTSVKVV